MAACNCHLLCGDWGLLLYLKSQKTTKARCGNKYGETLEESAALILLRRLSNARSTSDASLMTLSSVPGVSTYFLFAVEETEAH